MEFKVHRDRVWNDTMIDLMKFSPNQTYSCEVSVEFLDEKGIDAGGLRTEWVNLCIKEVTNPDFGLFILSSNGVTIQPNPFSYLVPDHLAHFRFFGRLIAKAILA
jgi:hypothetical protein